MKMRKNDSQFTVRRLWELKPKEKFNTLVVDVLFRYPGLNVLLGGEDGIIRIYEPPNPGEFETSQRKALTTLETKSGPVQCLCVHDVTRFYQKDLIVGDTSGMLTVFCNNQILSRQSISNKSINFVQVLQDRLGNVCIVSSDDSGVITGHLPSSELWRINLNDQQIPRVPGLSLYVKCLLAVEVTHSQGLTASYILASDNVGQLYVINQGKIVQNIKTPDPITAMCSGVFIPPSKLSIPPNLPDTNQTVTQIALGSANGAIYILHDFNLSQDEYANIGLPIMHLSSLTLPDMQSDLLLCGGHFNALQVFHEGKKYADYEVSDWLNSMCCVDLDGDEVKEVVVGCLDNTVQAVKITST